MSYARCGPSRNASNCNETNYGRLAAGTTNGRAIASAVNTKSRGKKKVKREADWSMQHSPMSRMTALIPENEALGMMECVACRTEKKSSACSNRGRDCASAQRRVNVLDNWK